MDLRHPGPNQARPAAGGNRTVRSSLVQPSPSIGAGLGPHDSSPDLGMLGVPGAFQDAHGGKDTIRAQWLHSPG